MSEFELLLQKAGLSVSEAAELLGYSEGHVYRWKRDDEPAREAVLKVLRMTVDSKRPPEGSPAFSFIDLFAGIGGLRKAMESIGGRCVFTSEWDRFAQQTYDANYKDNRPIEGDIREVDADSIPEHQVLVAGFPCQPFSIAGVSKKNALGRAHGFADETQGTLFFDVLRILQHHRPAAFLLENVKNLRSHDKGRTFEVVMRKLRDELGYFVPEPRVIDAAHFVPQHRERIVIVGFRKNVPFSFDDISLPPYGNKRMRDILHPEDGTEDPEGHFTLGNDATVNGKYTLTDKLWAYLQNYAAKHKAKGNGFGFGLVDGDSIARTLSARYYKDGSEILVSRGEGMNPRRLTPRECARLMGYPEDFQIPVSDTQAYKQFGNSVAVPVFAEVARAMGPHIRHLIEEEQKNREPLLPDVHDKATRSRNMAAIRGSDTKPEMIVRRGLHARGFRFRLHSKDLPGKPDLVLPKYRAVVFVNGCFWHGHDCPLFKWPASRAEFWHDKIRANIERDFRNRNLLEAKGWRVAAVWECALKGKGKMAAGDVIDSLSQWLLTADSKLVIEGFR